jgi:hypothetical protein
MTTVQLDHLIAFLQTDLAVPNNAIDLGLQRTQETPNLLPIVLWQYGVVSTAELDRIFDWMEQRPVPALPVLV